MILILFFFAVVIAAGLLVTFGFVFYLKNRGLSASRDQQINLYPPDPASYRPLFAPSEEELRAVEKAEANAENLRAQKDERAAAEKELIDRMESARSLLAEWSEAPDRKRLGEVFLAAADVKSAEFYSEISTNVIQVWKNEKIAGLTAADLAALLDSHLRLLPQQELDSGSLFWLRQEVAALRAEKNLQG
jgi:hypothetical protein